MSKWKVFVQGALCGVLVIALTWVSLESAHVLGRLECSLEHLLTELEK